MTKPGTVQHHARPGHHRPPWPRKERTTSATSQPTMAPKWARHTHTHAHQKAQNNGPKWAKRTHTHTCTQPPPPPPPPTSKADKDGMGDWQGMVAPKKQNIKQKGEKGDLSCRYLSLYIYIPNRYQGGGGLSTDKRCNCSGGESIHEGEGESIATETTATMTRTMIMSDDDDLDDYNDNEDDGADSASHGTNDDGDDDGRD